MATTALITTDSTAESRDPVFDAIADDLAARGFSIFPGGLPAPLGDLLWQHLRSIPAPEFEPAGTGRLQEFVVNNFVRKDSIVWIDANSEACRQWRAWTAALQGHLNRRLFLGLFSFESHFAHYRPGDFYRRHLDAFRGQANRVLSLVVYLNPGWQPEDGGELVLYGAHPTQQDRTRPQSSQDGLRVTPAFGTVVAFLSEEFPHEVLPAQRDRYSIAGWYRLNSSTSARVDPPR